MPKDKNTPPTPPLGFIQKEVWHIDPIKTNKREDTTPDLNFYYHSIPQNNQDNQEITISQVIELDITDTQAIILQLLCRSNNPNMDTATIVEDLLKTKRLWDSVLVDSDDLCVLTAIPNDTFLVDSIYILSSGKDNEGLEALIKSWNPTDLTIVKAAQTKESLRLTNDSVDCPKQLYYVNWTSLKTSI